MLFKKLFLFELGVDETFKLHSRVLITFKIEIKQKAFRKCQQAQNKYNTCFVV